MSGAVLAAAVSGGLSLTVTPSLVQGFGIGTVTTTQQLVGTVTGGTAPLTYLWTTSDPSIFPLSPSASATVFRRANVESGETYSTTATLTVTDASSQSKSAQAAVQFTGL